MSFPQYFPICVTVSRCKVCGNLQTLFVDWEPKNHHRVCSIHFPDGAPSEKYPDPTLNLGHESSASLTPKISLRDIKGIGDTNSDTARSSSPNLNLNQNFESSSMSTPRNSSRIVVKSTSDNIGNDPSNLGHEPCFRPKTRNSSRTGVQHTTSETIGKLLTVLCVLFFVYKVCYLRDKILVKVFLLQAEMNEKIHTASFNIVLYLYVKA